MLARSDQQALIRAEREKLRTHAWQFNLPAGRREELSGGRDELIGPDDADAAGRMKPVSIEQSGVPAARKKHGGQKQNCYLRQSFSSGFSELEAETAPGMTAVMIEHARD